MTNEQFYAAISIPSFMFLVNVMVIMWSSRGIEKRLDRIETDMKEFYRMHVKLEAKVDAK